MKPVAFTSEKDALLAATAEEVEFFHELCAQKAYRKKLQILIVEDQVFSQKLLNEILRNERCNKNNAAHTVDVASNIRDGWKMYLDRAPDITFLDLGLPDGCGHSLARAIKELDPSSFVVIVTASSYEEELRIACRNKVDGFIAKPYNRKHIFEYINRCSQKLPPREKQKLWTAAG